MRARGSVVVVFAAGCTIPAPWSDLVALRTLETTGAIGGVDSDGAGGLWVAFSKRSLTDKPDEVDLVHLDESGAEIQRFSYNDEHTDVQGLAFSGDAIWLNHSAGGGTDNDYIRKFDPATGVQIGSFALPQGMVDVDVRGDELVLSNLWNQIVTLDRATGGIESRSRTGAIGESVQRGLATTDDGKFWVANWSSELFLLGPDLQIEYRARPDEFGRHNNSHHGPYLAADGTDLIVANGWTIAWYRP